MSHHVHIKDLPLQGEHIDPSRVAKPARNLAITGAILLAFSLGMLLFGSETTRGQYAFSYLFAVFFGFTLVAGGIFWTLLHNLSNSGWGIVVRRMMESIGMLMPVVGLLALPLILVPELRHTLWKWTFYEDYAKKQLASEEVRDSFHRAWEAEVATATAARESALEAGQEGEAAIYQRRLDQIGDNPPSDSYMLRELLLELDGLLAVKYPFLNWTFFVFRFFAYFVVLTALIRFMYRLSTRQDKEGGVTNSLRARFHSSWGMIVFALCVSFLAIDWVMTLDFHWFSTMWGVYIFAGSALASMAVLVLVVSWLRSIGHLKHVVSEEHYHVMGKLLFAFTVFWAYIAFGQFFLIWYANLTEETSWFITRNTEHYNTLSIALVIFHFAVPFLFLIPAWVKRSPKLLTLAAAYLVVVHFLDVWLMIIPLRGPVVTGGLQHYIPGSIFGDIIACVGVLCVLTAVFLHNIRKASLFPCRDPRLLESLHLHN